MDHIQNRHTFYILDPQFQTQEEINRVAIPFRKNQTNIPCSDRVYLY